jgi:hypothetical protein
VTRVVGKIAQGGHHSGTGLAGDWCVISCCVGWCMHVEVAYVFGGNDCLQLLSPEHARGTLSCTVATPS